MVSRSLLGTAMLVALLGVTGCESSSDSYYPPPGPGTVVPETPARTTRTPEARAQRPDGRPPRGVLGAWQGGPGAAGGYLLKITRTGEYQLEHTKNTGFPAFVEEGYIVGDADELLFRPVVMNGFRSQERVATWASLPNSVTDLITISDPIFGDFDMVRDDS
jgi:hypothetical protein